MKRLLLFAAILPLLLLATPAHAQDAAPFAGHCFGDGTSTCLVPELSFDVTRIRLNGPDAGSLAAGAVPVGLGYSMLFWYDQWYASGVNAHGIIDFSQKGTDFFQVSGGFTLARYFHVVAVFDRVGGGNEWWAAFGASVPVDVQPTSVADKRAKAVRAARAAAPPPAEGSGS